MAGDGLEPAGDGHLFETSTSGRCAVCGEWWEHANHRAEHRRRPDVRKDSGRSP